MQPNKTPLDFEDALLQLENIVAQIENDEIKLEDALQQYHAGISLIKFCQDKLKNVEQKIKILDNADDSLKDFNIEQNN